MLKFKIFLLIVFLNVVHTRHGHGRRHTNHHQNRQQQFFQFQPHFQYQPQNNNFQRRNFQPPGAPFQPPGLPFQPQFPQSNNFFNSPQPQINSLPSSATIATLLPMTTQCSEVKFFNRTDDKFFGKMDLIAASDFNGIEIEIEFDGYIPVFANDLVASKSLNNRKFTIADDRKSLRRGEKIEINFIAKSSSEHLNLKSLKLNGRKICSSDDLKNIEDGCAKLELIDEVKSGRWDGLLTIYPKNPSNSVQVTIEIDTPAWALGNDFGDVKTLDQKLFTITRRGSFHPSGNKKNSINFFVKFDELAVIPKITKIYVDGVQVCVAGLNVEEESENVVAENATSKPIETTDNIKLSDLHFENFPTVVTIPTNVNNTNFPCGGSNNVINSRLNNGEKANLEQFPFHVAIFRDDLYTCGGSIISENFVLTACHCVVDEINRKISEDKIKLLFGSVDLKSLNGNEIIRNVDQIIPHPDYSYDKILKQDIALIRIKGKLQFSSSIRSICLSGNQTSINIHLNKKAIVLGFGSNEKSKSPVRYLNYGKMTLIGRQECIESKLIYALLSENSAFCAISVDNMTVCSGDSGSGLITIENAKFYLTGISSVSVTDSSGKCNPQLPVAFTYVNNFYNWIMQNIS